MSREMTNVVSGIAPQITSTAYAPASDPKERDRHRPYDEICGDEHELSESAAALDGVCTLFEIVEIVKIV